MLAIHFRCVPRLKYPAGASSVALCACLLLSACATPVPPPDTAQATLPVKRGCFEGQTVFHITTDVSDAAVAQEKKANFAPRLAYALPALQVRSSEPQTRQPSSVDKVYAVTNHEQGNVFESAPLPVGHSSREAAYSPLWLMLTVTWKPHTDKRVLKSEEEVLDAAEKGWIDVASTGVIVNCPIVHRGALGGLPGVAIKEP